MTAITVVTVANGALDLIGERPIASFDDANRKAARTCKRVFDDERDKLLREEPWQFAKQQFAPAAQVTPPNTLYAYRYIMPPECVQVTAIEGVPDDGWECESPGNDATLGVVLDCNVAGAKIWGTRRVVNPAQWDPLFSAVFELRLAARLNPGLGRDKSKTSDFLTQAEAKLATAKRRDSQTRQRQQVNRDTSFVRARRGLRSL